ncbi:hypothetical protein ANN_16434 [Periplaneta americana]|uniref:DUF4817 domain-containing protein n=1 Tax=Periplaneta americana TaxID=6978 RepID=A0ABQ8SIZ6_PERAM|nr:hypothetical protein ANN_16434 [Periplaneta americana]
MKIAGQKEAKHEIRREERKNGTGRGEILDIVGLMPMSYLGVERGKKERDEKKGLEETGKRKEYMKKESKKRNDKEKWERKKGQEERRKKKWDENKKRSLPSKETLRGHSDSSFRGEGYIQCCVGVRLCDMYSNQELAEIHFMYGKADGNAALARRLYQERHPQRQYPDRKTFVRLHYRLCEYGKFNSSGLGRERPRSTTPEVQEEILEAVNMTPSISTRRVALQVNVPHTTV